MSEEIKIEGQNKANEQNPRKLSEEKDDKELNKDKEINVKDISVNLGKNQQNPKITEKSNEDGTNSDVLKSNNDKDNHEKEVKLV